MKKVLSEVYKNYMALIVAGVVLLAYNSTKSAVVNISNDIKKFVEFYRNNSKTDSIQTERLIGLEINQGKYITKSESDSKDSLFVVYLEEIKHNQVIFQNQVVDRYDKKCELLTNNQHKILGILEGAGISYLDSVTYNVVFIITDSAPAMLVRNGMVVAE